MERLLLIGNSRWHWLHGGSSWHTSPGEGLRQFQQQPAQHWAAVGLVPKPLEAWRGCQISAADVPLKQQQAGLGVDRALVGWGAWQRSSTAVLVVDAGTAVSFTLVDRNGNFCGGRIMAGAALQLSSLHQATAGLPAVTKLEITEAWPHTTKEAMQAGVLNGMAAALIFAAKDLPKGWEGAAIWLTGGDGELLLPLLAAAGLKPQWAPNLALEALAEIKAEFPSR